MSQERMTPESNDDLFFTAVRYALEDLPLSERDAFEQRLLADQQARECLVQAVRLCQVASEGLRPEVEPAERKAADMATSEWHSRPWQWRPWQWRRPAAWASLALAASILLAVVIAGVGDRGRPVGDGSPNDSEKQLAVAWVNSAEIIEAVDSRSDGAIASLDITEPFSPDETIETGGDWLFEAITAPHSPAVSEPSTANHQEG